MKTLWAKVYCGQRGITVDSSPMDVINALMLDGLDDTVRQDEVQDYLQQLRDELSDGQAQFLQD